MQELYHLIKSLDANEKKYFRRFGLKDATKGKSNTEILFEIIDALDEFDEEKILNRLKREKLDKQVAHLKTYLYEILLDTLLWYNKEKIHGFDTSFELAKIHLLEDRGLDEEALRLSERLVKKNSSRDSFIEKWNALSKSIHYASNEFLSDKKTEFSEVNDWMEQRGALLAQMQRYHEYHSLLIQQLRIMRKAMQARSDEDLKALNEIFNQKIVQEKKSADSRDSRFVFHTLRVHHFQIFNQWKDFFEETKALTEYAKKEGIENFSMMNVLWAYSQLTQACYFTQQWKLLEKYLDELKDIQVNNQTEVMAQFTYYTQLAITLFDFKRDEKSLKELLRETVSHLKQFKNRLRPDVRLAITITAASAFVEYGEYGTAIDVCEDFLINYDSGIRLDALLMLYVYEFICHLEMGNMLYVNNTIQNVYRYFLRNDYKGEFESALMHVFKKISEMESYGQHKKEIQKLKDELNEAGGSASNRQHLALLPIVQSFLDAKLANQKIHVFAANQKMS